MKPKIYVDQLVYGDQTLKDALLDDGVIKWITPGPYSVYRLTLPNGKSYIGKTSRALKERWKYGWGYVCNYEFFNDILTYGWENVEKACIASGIDNHYASLLEKSHIDQEHTLYPNGYNRCTGGDRGYTYPPEIRQLMNEAFSKHILQIDKDTGDIIQEWPSVSAAARELGLQHSHISEAASGKRKSTGGFKWKYAD